MSDDVLERLRALIQVDPNNRGLGKNPTANLFNASPDDLAAACRSIAEHPKPAVAVVTGFFIPHGTPPADETDGPLGAVWLARALAPLGIKVALFSEHGGKQAMRAGLSAGLKDAVQVRSFPGPSFPWDAWVTEHWRNFCRWFDLTHLIALERVGPSHTLDSLLAQFAAVGEERETCPEFLSEVDAEHRDRPHNMRGLDISEYTAPAHLLFECVRDERPEVATIGIGDGGNEMGMGKIPWEVIRRNIPNGARIACRVATDHLIVCGVSNWGAYALGHGIRALRGAPLEPALYDAAVEAEVLQRMIEAGPLVDGVTGQQSLSVDGLPFERYVAPLVAMGRMN